MKMHSEPAWQITAEDRAKAIEIVRGLMESGTPAEQLEAVDLLLQMNEQNRSAPEGQFPPGWWNHAKN